VPGIDPDARRAFFNDQQSTILGIVNMFSGGALERLSIFAMGVMPYISASIIVQMLSMVCRSLGWSAQGRRVGQAQAHADHALRHRRPRRLPVVRRSGDAAERRHGAHARLGTFLFTATVTMTTGTMFLMWLGEQITERGIGNGISMIILAGIIAGLPGAVGRTIEQVNTGEMSGPFAICC
jgi:preprotein translocase subunit SecY